MRTASWVRHTFKVCFAASALLVPALTGFGQINDAEARRVAAYPLDDKIRRMAASPRAAAILKSHGISAEDMVMTSSAMTAVIIMKLSTETGAGKNDANKLDWEASSPQHVKFYEGNKAEIKRDQDDLVKAALQR